MTFDAMSNSPSHSQLNTMKIWKENLVIYQKSLKAFLQAPLHYCVNNKMLECDWLLRALIYGIIGCFRSKLSNLTCPITTIHSQTGQIGQLSSQ